MKNLILLVLLTLSFGFIESEKVVFKSTDGKTKITANNEWLAAGNMKGVEIYIFKENNEKKSRATIVISKDTKLPKGTDLSLYSAGKLFLQTSVLNTSPSFSGIKIIKENSFNYYEYEYINKDFVKMKTLLYHALIGSIGYQMTITAPFKGFNKHYELFNKIADSLVIEP